MIDVPIRSLTVSDFRRIEGTRVLPFDAPVVLIHGSNGTGKTSVLSALELGLTGRNRSMERLNDRYAAYLPFLGQPYATVRVDVADALQAGTPGTPLTVNGARIDGAPAFAEEAARFYGERCYLDQASLGRLLELYQLREGKEESALARFVNELLGLEKLDALRTGLHDATDLRLLKKLATGVDDAAAKAQNATTELADQSTALEQAQRERDAARAATVQALDSLRAVATEGMNDAELLQFARTTLEDETTLVTTANAAAIHQELIALGGRISALIERPSMQRIIEARAALDSVTSEREEWIATYGPPIQAWDAAAHDLGAKSPSDHRDAGRQTMARVRSELEVDEALRAQVSASQAQLLAERTELEHVQARFTDAREHSSALIESLVALRTVVQDNTCPVCDRDFTELGESSLPEHIDTKLARLTAHAQQLVVLREERNTIAARLARSEVAHDQLNTRVLPAGDRHALEQQQSALTGLVHDLDALEPSIAAGNVLEQRQQTARETLDALKAASSEDEQIRAELARYATPLDISEPVLKDSPRDSWRKLMDRAAAEVARLNGLAVSRRAVADGADRLEAALARQAAAMDSVVDTAKRKTHWDARVNEARRRQMVAREVHEAATRARTIVVQRVFTESLNDVWKSVFTRLAPNEGFIPSFGIPTATKTALDIKLETTYRTGEVGGAPQMMLSAGNLNTAALSLFLALHLAVQPVVPCLVFDDPVQAMDEVHVAQFAGLIRVLAKQHQRQVIIAVHERELFEYLALELSPAYDGDELITIELGERADDEDKGITRHTWTQDLAIAG